ncbi:MAG: hypothetical protein ACOC8D_00960 [bacterium]
MLVVVLAALATHYVVRHQIAPHALARAYYADRVLEGVREPPYRYRVLKPVMGSAVERCLEGVLAKRRDRHVAAYALIALVTFAGVFGLLHGYLRDLLGEGAALVGLLLFQGVVPLSVTGQMMMGDYLTLLFYLVGFRLMLGGREAYLPLLVAVAALNREQAVVMVAFYGVYVASQGMVGHLRKRAVIYGSLVAYVLVFAGLRIALGRPPSRFTMGLHLAHNTAPANLWGQILPVWGLGVLPLAALSVVAYRRSNRFFRAGLWCLIPYTAAFFVKGNLWELAKFLPAYLILLPMGLQALCGRFIPEAMPSHQPRPQAAQARAGLGGAEPSVAPEPACDELTCAPTLPCPPP